MNKYRKVLGLLAFLLLAFGLGGIFFIRDRSMTAFEPPSSRLMLELIQQQLSFAPRFMGSPGHARVQEWIEQRLRSFDGVEVIIQEWDDARVPAVTLRNIIGRLAPEKEQRIILATHYDTKRFADRDTQRPSAPVPGANDGASGVAVLIEALRVLQLNRTEIPVGVDVVFFDGEEWEQQYQAGEWQPLGSSYFAGHLEELYPTQKPVMGIVVDMVCDKELRIKQEPASLRHTAQQVQAFWKIARSVAPSVFADEVSQEILDDHTPLNAAGIPTMLLIDADYPFFHTTEDTIDKCSLESLEIVANALLQYLASSNKK